LESRKNEVKKEGGFSQVARMQSARIVLPPGYQGFHFSSCDPWPFQGFQPSVGQDYQGEDHGLKSI
jgi:hypothetical protein